MGADGWTCGTWVGPWLKGAAPPGITICGSSAERSQGTRLPLWMRGWGGSPHSGHMRHTAKGEGLWLQGEQRPCIGTPSGSGSHPGKVTRALPAAGTLRQFR